MNKKLTGTIGEQGFSAWICDPDLDGDVAFRMEFDTLDGVLESTEYFHDLASAEKSLRSALERLGAIINE